MPQVGLGFTDVPADFVPSDTTDTSTTPWWVPLVQTGVMTTQQVVDTQLIPPAPPNFPAPYYPGSTPYTAVSSITSSPLFLPVVLIGAFLLLRRK